jgi:ribosomal protein L17
MSCYFRHMEGIFAEAGIQVTKENKKELDRVLHELVDVKYKSCSATWSRIKELRADEVSRRKLIDDLKARWKNKGLS